MLLNTKYCNYHYIGAKWMGWRLKPTSSLSFDRQFVGNNNIDVKAPNHWTSWREYTGDRLGCTQANVKL